VQLQAAAVSQVQINPFAPKQLLVLTPTTVLVYNLLTMEPIVTLNAPSGCLSWAHAAFVQDNGFVAWTKVCCCGERGRCSSLGTVLHALPSSVCCGSAISEVGGESAHSPAQDGTAALYTLPGVERDDTFNLLPNEEAFKVGAAHWAW